MNRSMIIRPAVIAGMFGLAACATVPVPGYEASVDNVQKLKSAGAAPVTVTSVTPSGQKANNERISIRGNSATSPVGSGFADYVKNALEQELRRAELLSPDAPVKISGKVVENDIDAASSIGTGTLAVEVTVTSGGAERYRKVVRGTTTWGSSFVGAIAIPAAIQSYPRTVQTFLSQLYADPDFISALKGPAAAAPASTPAVPQPPKG